MARQNILSLIIALCICAFSGFNSTCSDFDMCGNDVTNEVASPDGKIKAVVFERDCGATTGFSTQISVLPDSKLLPNEGANLFYATSKNEKVKLTEKGVLQNLEVKWLSETKLLIRYDSLAEVSTQKPPQGVEVVYEKIP